MCLYCLHFKFVLLLKRENIQCLKFLEFLKFPAKNLKMRLFCKIFYVVFFLFKVINIFYIVLSHLPAINTKKKTRLQNLRQMNV